MSNHTSRTGSLYVVARWRVRSLRECSRPGCDEGVSNVIVLLGFGDVGVLRVCERCADVIENGLVAPSDHPEARRTKRRKAYARECARKAAVGG